MALPVYSSKDVTVAFGGVALEGLAADNFITFTPNSDETDEEVGADGQSMISYMADISGACTVSLQQSSPSNLVLSGVVGTQRATRQLQIANLTVTDPSGSVIAFMRNCHIKSKPEIGLGASATGTTRDWVFYCQEMFYTSTPDGLVADDTAARVASAVDTIVSNI